MLGAHAECENRDAFLILPCTVKGCMKRRGKSLRKLAALTSGAITAECLNWRIPKKISPVYGRWMICLPSPGFQRKMPLKRALRFKRHSRRKFYKRRCPCRTVLCLQSVCKGARRYGADIYEHTQVTSVKRVNGEYCITTSGGDVYADKVAVASGVWSGFQPARLGTAFFPVKENAFPCGMTIPR